MRAATLAALLLLAGITALAWRRYSDEMTYARAESYWRTGDFEKAALECERVLVRRPNHVGAIALYRNISRSLWEPSAYQSVVHGPVETKAGFAEVDAAMARAEQALSAWEIDEAERETRRILEYAKWLPDGVELRTHVSSARDLQRRIQAARESRCGP